jgi:hypothetical protein
MCDPVSGLPTPLGGGVGEWVIRKGNKFYLLFLSNSLRMDYLVMITDRNYGGSSMSVSKVCKGCGVDKVATTEFFHSNKTTKDGLQGKCKVCIKAYQQGRKDKRRETQAKWREKNREKINEQAQQWREDNREKTRQIARDHYYRNHDNILEKYATDEYKERQEKWRAENHDKVKGYKRKWNRDNRDYRNEWERERCKTDPCYRLRRSVSRSVNIALKHTDGSKGGSSTFEYLPYTLQALREHLENQFEDWMTWDNWGVPKDGERTWHIDHIHPQSLLPYDTLDHPNFLKCWSLSNLRPMDAIENIQKGNKLL